MKLLKKEILYQLERHPHGWLVFGGERDGIPTFGIPCESLQEFTKLCPSGHMDSGISGALDAMMCFGEPSELELWRKEINAAVDATSLSPAEKWLNKTDVGISALTIFIALIHNTQLEGEAGWYYRHEFTPDIPHDAADFGRCQRLLDLTPAWESQLEEVAKKFPDTKWSKLVPKWQELKELYRADKNADLYAALSAL